MRRNKGFTLVELLIVIGLVAILSVAVLATINPIEQANKARDASKKNEAAEVLSAYERYYANSLSYPWMFYTDADGISPLTIDSSILLESNMAGFGICYLNGGSAYDEGQCNSNGVDEVGVLISADELKSSFANKSAFRNDESIEKMWLIKNSGENSGIYVCFIPKASSNRENVERLRCIDDGSGAVPMGVYRVDESGRCTSYVENWDEPEFGTRAMFMCVPE